MVNINRSKYTETFIWELIPRLPYKAYLLHGGALPLYDDDDRHFLSNWKILQQLASLLENLFHLEENYFLRQSIGSYLEARKVKLVLAQFGPVGAQMQSITRDLGIPLIVYFHGYDVFHREILEKNLPQYRELFGEAEKIIAVSASMLQALLALGAPAEKLIHLPAFVRLELFPYTDHSTLGPHFLAVGRFAETKSPHLTILAFQKVLAEIPEATLTFIGKGGGGELFEACLILVRALRMEKSVFFEGVQTHEQVAGAMRTARVFVQDSLTTPENGDREGKPVAIMEAMAAGLPVVATDHSGIPELIENGVSGFLVPEYDIGAMYEKMLLLAKDDALVARMGRAASAAVRNNQLIAKNLELLSDIVNKHLAG